MHECVSVSPKSSSVIILISGHLRSLADTYKSILAMAASLDADILVHTWSDSEMQTATWHAPEEYAPTKQLLRYIENDPRVKCVIVEDQPEWWASPGNTKMLSPMYEGIKRATNYALAYLETEHSKYETYIRYRPDQHCENASDILIDLECSLRYTKNVLMIPHNWAYAAGIYYDGYWMANRSAHLEILEKLESLCQSKLAVRPWLPSEMSERRILSAILAAGLQINNSAITVGIKRSNGRLGPIFSSRQSSHYEFLRSAFLMCYFRLSKFFRP
jgi:hypothetical protein